MHHQQIQNDVYRLSLVWQRSLTLSFTANQQKKVPKLCKLNHVLLSDLIYAWKTSKHVFSSVGHVPKTALRVNQQGTWTTFHYLPRQWVHEKEWMEWTCCIHIIITLSFHNLNLSFSSCASQKINMSHIGSTCMSYIQGKSVTTSLHRISLKHPWGFKNLYPIKIY